MTLHDLDTIDTYCQAIHPDPVALAQFPPAYDHSVYFADCLAKSIGTTVSGVILAPPGQDVTEEATWVCVTGNGLYSAAHAQFYTLCHTALPALLAEVRRCWGVLGIAGHPETEGGAA